MSERVLTARALNRALLARQLLLERADLSIEAALEQVGGLQAQYAPSMYVGLWTRLRSFERESLTRALEAGTVVQATLMRSTIHLVTRREFWRFEAGGHRARQAAVARIRTAPGPAELEAASERLRVALADGPRSVAELDGLAAGFIGNLGLWVPLVRVPPSATWARRRADRLALADRWVGPCDATEAEGLAQLVQSYLRGFGPAPWRDIAAWAGIPVADARRGGESVDLVRYRDEAGAELVDLPGAPLPEPGTPAPARFLPHWDNSLLAHARRTGLVPEAIRPQIFNSKNPFSVGCVMVDGRVIGAWGYRDRRVVVDWFEPIGAADAAAVEQERLALEAFHA